MKKKLITLLSFILAVVMCFACIACGDDDDDSTTKSKTSAEMAAIGRVIDGVQKLASTDKFKATVQGSFTQSRTVPNSPANNWRTDLNVTARKSGDWVRFNGTADDDTVDGYINLATGYTYYPYSSYDYTTGSYVTERGKYGYENSMPGGIFDLYKDLIAQEASSLSNMNSAGLSWLSNYISYNSRTKKVTIDFNIGDEVNKYLNALYTNADGSLYDFLNAALADRYTGNTPAASALIDELLDEFDKNKNKTLGEFIEIIEQDSGMSLEQILQFSSVAMDADMLKKIRARKLGELATAALNIINEEVQISESEMADYLFTQKVTVPRDLKDKLAAFKPMIVALMQNYPMQSVISALDLSSTVERQYLFTSLSGNAEITFDNSGAISAATVDFNIGQSYKYTAMGTASNVRRTETYSGNYTLSVENLPASEQSEVEFDKSKISENAFSSRVEAVADGQNNTTFYFEKGTFSSIGFNLSGARAYYYDDTYYNQINVAIFGKLTYNSADSTFVLDKSVMAGLVNNGFAYGDNFYIEVPLNSTLITSNGTVENIRVIVTYMPRTLSIEDLLANAMPSADIYA